MSWTKMNHETELQLIRWRYRYKIGYKSGALNFLIGLQDSFVRLTDS